MRNELSAQLNKLTTIVFLATITLIPLVVATLTTDFYETPKLILLFIITCILLLLKGLSWLFAGKVSVTRTPLDLPLLLFLAVILISVFANPLRLPYISLFGNLPRVHGSAISWVIYILFYFLATSHFKKTGEIKVALGGVLLSGAILAVVGLCSYFGLYLPLAFARTANFTLTGSTFSSNAIMVLALPVILLSISGVKKLIPQTAAIVLGVLFALVIGLTADTTTLLAAVITIILTFYVERKSLDLAKFSPAKVLTFLPILVMALALILSRIPMGGSNILYAKSQNFPRELQLPLSTSWKVSAGAFRDSPFFGTGPSTFLFDFASYKPADYNATTLWSVRFETAFDEFFQLLATVGGLGLIAFLFFCLMVINFSFKAIKKADDDGLNSTVALSAISGVVLLALHPSTLVLIVLFMAVLACLMALNKSDYDKVQDLSIGIKAWNPTKSDLIAGDALPSIIFLAFIAVVLFSLFKASGMILADVHHRKALDAAATQGLTTYNELVAAEQLNPNADLYRTDLAQTNFALANAIAQAKGPTQASPSGSLTASDKQNIQTLLSQSINEGRAAVTLNPRNSQNWEILASIYRQISGVAQNAIQFSLDSYGRAIQQDPLNPLLRLSVGGVYYSLQNYDLAIRFFTDAINLKPDYANAYYNLSVAYRDKGDLQSAVQSGETLLTLIDKNSADYKTASDYLDGLKAKLASKDTTASDSATTAPAAGATSALQQKELPKVLNLPEPSSIATPSAVKK